MKKDTIPRLEGWMTVAEAAHFLEQSRARTHQLISEDRFDIVDLRVVGEKHVILIKQEAVIAYLKISLHKKANARRNKALALA